MKDRRRLDLDSTCSDNGASGAGWLRQGQSTALAIVWSGEEPDRAGEIAFVPGGKPGPVQILGRGEPSDADTHGRLSFARIRGSVVEPQPALRTASLSRSQLRAQVIDDGVLEVENTGRLRLIGPEGETRRLRVRAGDTVQLGGQLLFLVVQRPFPGPPAKVEANLTTPFPFGTSDSNGIVGESAAAWALRERIAFVGARRGHVIVHGPSGSGKELVARAVHAASQHPGRPLISRNAATIPDGIADAELFGNIRNYPNAGSPERSGLIGEADGTSLFLDEFGELPAAIQAHLLRVLDSGEYQRLGDPRVRRSEFRLIAATNRPLSLLKEDVLARIPFRIEVPGFEARREDVPLLARHILKVMFEEDPGLARHHGEPPALSLRFTRELVTTAYATHARELAAVLLRAVEHGHEGVLEPAPRSERSRPSPTGTAGGSGATIPPAGEGVLTPDAIQRSLDKHNGNIEKAWRALGLSSRHSLARLVRKHGLEVRKRPT
jgi:two-component system nitrogen regulation response regulator GlnG/two-component system response regulator HydG